MNRMPSTILSCSVLALAALPALYGQVQITVRPAAVQLHIGNQHQFTATVTGAANRTITWMVNGIAGGDAAAGRIAADGRYTTPAALPASAAVTVTAVHTESGTASAGAVVTLFHPYPMLASVHPERIQTGPFTLMVNGSGFVPGARVRLGGAELETAFVSATRLRAAGALAESSSGTAAVTVVNPDPGGRASAGIVIRLNEPGDYDPQVTIGAAARFLDQAAFGPDRASIERVLRLGYSGWIDEQFEAPVSPYPDPETIGLGLGPLQARFFTNAVHGADQLRQRVALALGQIWVVSGSVAFLPERYVPYLRILQQHAFGNYRDLMREMTLNPAMGDYLSMVNNVRADPARGTRPNENYARELLQLFTIGTDMLNPDGTFMLDANGQRIPAYTQEQIHDFARALTGWTYPTQPGRAPAARNPAFYVGRMTPWEANHDKGRKVLLLDFELPPGRRAEEDLNSVVDHLFFHPNIGPFVSRNLIQHLVTSNPSPEYVARVARVFMGESGEHGGLKQVVRAILLDPEARAGDDNLHVQPGSGEGRLKAPVVWLASLLRALGAVVNDTNTLAGRASALGQNIHFPPSVFGFYSPGHRIPGTNLLGPEFQILTPSTALDRANQVNAIIYGSLGAGTQIDLSGWTNLANTPDELLDEIGAVFFHRQMPAGVRSILQEAVAATAGARARAQAALYLAASSGYYAVAR
jgi:hypothetical protein